MQKLKNLKILLKKLYAQKGKKVIFHTWEHVNFVATKAVKFAKLIKANAAIVETAALCHDLNYLVDRKSQPGVASKIRSTMLLRSGYSSDEVEWIEQIILEADIVTRSKKISPEGMALSDADTLFKALPITDILFTGNALIERKIDIAKLAKKILADQTKLMRAGIYFYTPYAKKHYLKWAKTKLELWSNLQESLGDADVRLLLSRPGD